MSRRIHHINFIVRDLDAAVTTYERVLDMPVTSRTHLDSRGVDLAHFQLGDTRIVLVQPVRPGTVPARYLEEHGEGFFLLSVGVDSLDREVDRLGETAFSGPERRGEEGWRVRDLDSDATFGAQLQFTESLTAK
jgi:methylmalonyl-CoA/ethylmalonyl-CoA epimerase